MVESNSVAGALLLGMTEIERWVYDSYGATRVLVFLDDRLQTIESF